MYKLKTKSLMLFLLLILFAVCVSVSIGLSDNDIFNGTTSFEEIKKMVENIVVNGSENRTKFENQLQPGIDNFTSENNTKSNYNALTGGTGELKSINEKHSVSGKEVQVTCMTTITLLDMVVQFDRNTHDISYLTVDYNPELKKGKDKLLKIEGPISGVCANGFISCRAGTWSDCSYYKWDFDGEDKQLKYVPVDPGNLTACYCFNKACSQASTQDFERTVMDSLATGILGAFRKAYPDLSVASIQREAYHMIITGQIQKPCNQDSSSLADQDVGGFPLFELMENPGKVLGFQSSLEQTGTSMEQAEIQNTNSTYYIVEHARRPSSNETLYSCEIINRFDINVERLNPGKDCHIFSCDEVTDEHGYCEKKVKYAYYKVKKSASCEGFPNEEDYKKHFGFKTLDNAIWCTNNNVDTDDCSRDLKKYKNGLILTYDWKSSWAYTPVRGFNRNDVAYAYSEAEPWERKNLSSCAELVGKVVDPHVFQRQSKHCKWHKAFLVYRENKSYVVYDKFIFSRRNECTNYENKNNCRLLEEQVCNIKGECVLTVHNGNPTGIMLLPDCYTASGLKSYTICYDGSTLYVNGSPFRVDDEMWYTVKRTYACKKTQIDTKLDENTISALEKRIKIIKQKTEKMNFNETNPYGGCVAMCKVAIRKKKNVAGADTSMGAVESTYRDIGNEEYVEIVYRECINNQCPVNDNEEVLSNCTCGSAGKDFSEFMRAAGMLKMLQNATADVICSSGQKATNDMETPPEGEKK